MATTSTPAPSEVRAHEARWRTSVRRVTKLGRRVGDRTKRVVLVVALLLLGARIAAPYAIEAYLDSRLRALDGYTGDIEDVDLALFRGAYRIEGLRIDKTDGGAPVPFLAVRTIDLSVEWGALLDGKIVAEVDIDRPVLNFVLEGRQRQTGLEIDWPELVDDFVPLTVNRVTVEQGEVHYRAYNRRPRVDVVADRISLSAYDLSTESERGALPSRAHLRARVQESGRLVADARIDPSAGHPTFTLAVRLRELEIRELNPFLRAYAGVDAETGTLYVYSEVRARDGRFEGYVKPMAHELSVFQLGEDGSFLDQVGDFFAEVVLELFENHRNDTLAADVPISGTFERAEISTWAMVVSALKNAFIRALEHGLHDRSAWRTADADELRTGRRGERAEPLSAPRADAEARAEALEERAERLEERRTEARRREAR